MIVPSEIRIELSAARILLYEGVQFDRVDDCNSPFSWVATSEHVPDLIELSQKARHDPKLDSDPESWSLARARIK